MSGQNRNPAGFEDKITAHSPSTSALDDKSAYSSDLDDNYAIYKDNADQEIDPAEEKRVLRKIDQRLIPILM
jgi:hypothetical protein